MWLKDCVKELLAAMLTAAFIIFTGMGIIPPEAFVGVAVAVIMYYFEERSKESLKREIATLKEILNASMKNKEKEAKHG